MMKVRSSAKCAGVRLALKAHNDNNISFIADAMLGSLARKLRFFGFDTLYIVHVHDDQILKLGIDQDRIILTADRELFKRIVKVKAKGVLVSSADDLDDLAHILVKNGITSVGVHSIGSRCTVCNGILARKKSEQVTDSVPDKVAKCHSKFYQCTECGKVYWEGGHFQHIKVFAKSLDLKLAKYTLVTSYQKVKIT